MVQPIWAGKSTMLKERSALRKNQLLNPVDLNVLIKMSGIGDCVIPSAARNLLIGISTT